MTHDELLAGVTIIERALDLAVEEGEITQDEERTARQFIADSLRRIEESRQ